MKNIKHFIDYIVAVILIFVTLPIFILLFVIVRLTMGGPVLFKQRRPGLHGEIFTIYKFRTMKEVYDNSGVLLPDSERITKIGKTMRNLSLDELPQLYNVLKGELSLVGPRPLLVEYLDIYTEDEKHRHDVKPGITGWAQVNGRNTISWKEKFELDIWYVNNWSLFLDVKIFFLTILKVIKKSDIQQSESVTMPPYNGNN